MATPQQRTRRWWKEGVCYQVWPLSFKDSNDDGCGDIPGLTSKLDYLHELGVDYIWLSPMYASPRDDYGYDVADYESVDPTFGTLQDMDDLIAGLRTRGMRLILDLVVNHTSSEHKWFKESARSRDNEFSNYYIWRDPKIVDGERCPPNNWRSLFGPGSAWEYVESRDQYYLHLFLTSMPDLNWEDSVVRQAIYKSAIKFWLDRGVSGFRVDVVSFYSKDLSFPDAPIIDPGERYQVPALEMIANGPQMHYYLQEQRDEAFNKPGEDLVLVGEIGSASQGDLERYLSPANRELDMVFDFAAYDAGGPHFDKPWVEWTDERCLKELRKALKKTQGYLTSDLWPTTYFENHDQPRSITNFGSRNPNFYSQSGKLLALILATMSGTLFVYQGQEIGMRNVPKTWPLSDLKDPFWLSFIDEAYKKFPDDPVKQDLALDAFQRGGRDHSRTPIQWSAEEPSAGFCSGKPWIRINENFREHVNVADQTNDPDSLLSFWRRAIRFRKSQHETLIYGIPTFVDNDNEHILSVIKSERTETGPGKRLIVVMNYTDGIQSFPDLQESEIKGKIGELLFGTGSGVGRDELQPWEGRVFNLLASH